MEGSIEQITDILKRLMDVRTLDARLWDTADVATYLKLNVAHVRRSLLTRSDFPRAVDLPGAGNEPIRRFRPDDVRDWAEKFRR
ncbi:hypothetical protein ASC98_17740 [Rhizobacter sp. Root1238]|nr:hypothetical protein ASC98_17740 [Rhizobacter sp. Root1238]